MLRSADLMIHHGGNNSVQECLAAGVRQLVLPMSTDQFANAADLEHAGFAVAASPNGTTRALATAIETALGVPPPGPVQMPDRTELFGA
jgi:UDP:flavonoid glycosyltransferase YjiC (YdhE family)